MSSSAPPPTRTYGLSEWALWGRRATRIPSPQRPDSLLPAVLNPRRPRTAFGLPQPRLGSPTPQFGVPCFPPLEQKLRKDKSDRTSLSSSVEDLKFRQTKEGMESSQTNSQDARCQPVPFPPERVRKLLLNLKSSLGREEGQPLSFEDWSPIAGRPSNTLASWCDSGEAHQIQALLASLERLPEQAQHQLLDEACRIHPTLQHRRLGHGFLATSRLKEILRKPSGFTLIRGNPAHMRTFLLAALGNSFNQAHPGGKVVAGLDIQPAEFLAPVIGVT